MGPFQIYITEKAVLRDFTTLTEAEKQALTRTMPFDPKTQEIYQIQIGALADTQRTYHNRMQKRRKSFERADRCYVDIQVGHPEIRLLGIAPGKTAHSQPDPIELEGELLFEIGLSSAIKLQLKGKAKKTIRRNSHAILATLVAPYAQWTFLKPYLREQQEFHTHLLCIVPAGLKEEDRFVRCKVNVCDGGRLLGGAIREKVGL